MDGSGAEIATRGGHISLDSRRLLETGIPCQHRARSRARFRELLWTIDELELDGGPWSD